VSASASKIVMTRAWRDEHLTKADEALEEATRTLRISIPTVSGVPAANAWVEIAKAHYRAVALAMETQQP